MLNTKKAFSSFSVDDIQKAKEFRARPPDWNCPAVRKALSLYLYLAAQKL